MKKNMNQIFGTDDLVWPQEETRIKMSKELFSF